MHQETASRRNVAGVRRHGSCQGRSATPTPGAAYPARFRLLCKSACSQSLTYHGNLSAVNPFDPNSTSNPYGRYGSPLSPDSMNSPYGRYGSPYSPDSPNNPYLGHGLPLGGENYLVKHCDGD